MSAEKVVAENSVEIMADISKVPFIFYDIDVIKHKLTIENSLNFGLINITGKLIIGVDN